MPDELNDNPDPEAPTPAAKGQFPELKHGVKSSNMDTSPIEPGNIEVLQILDEHGQLDKSLDPPLDDELLVKIHRGLVLTRAFDHRMLTMQRQGEMGTFAPNLGQEACQLGQVIPLSRKDWYSPSYRSFGAQIWRGWSMERLLLLWAGYHEGFPPPAGVNRRRITCTSRRRGGHGHELQVRCLVHGRELR